MNHDMDIQASPKVDLVVFGDHEFEMSILVDKILQTQEYQLANVPHGQCVKTDEGAYARVYYTDRGNTMPVVILTQNNPAFRECYPMPFVPEESRFTTTFSSTDALHRMAELMSLMVTAQEHFNTVIGKEIDLPYVFAYPEEFYSILDFSYFVTISEFVSKATIGMAIRRTKHGVYAALTMDLSTDDESETPLVIFSLISL